MQKEFQLVRDIEYIFKCFNKYIIFLKKETIFIALRLNI